MRSTPSFDLPAPSGLGAHQLRRAMELSAEAVTGRQPRHEPFRDAERAAFWFSPVLAALFAIVLGSMSLVGLKEQIVRAVPASGALYAAIGMPVNVRGLEFRGVTSRVAGENGQRLLKVKGEIANLRSAPTQVPRVEVVVEEENGRPLYRWTAAMPKPKLGGGESVTFETRLVAPPEAGRDVRVRFAQAN